MDAYVEARVCTWSLVVRQVGKAEPEGLVEKSGPGRFPSNSLSQVGSLKSFLMFLKLNY